MNDKKFYSVSELSGLVGVARTTINDWLTRYNDYLESELRGKRRVYSDRTVAVLQEVAALREAGKSGFEIDQALAERHPVNPEVAPVTETEDGEEDGAEAPRPEGVSPLNDAESALPALSDAAEALPAARQLTEAGRQFADELRQVVAALKSQHEETARLLAAARRRNRRMLAGGIAALALVLLAVFYGVRELQKQYDAREDKLAEQLSAEMSSARDTWDSQRKRLEQEAQAWEKRRQEDLAAERKRSDTERAQLQSQWEEQQRKDVAARLEILAELEKQKSAFHLRMEEMRKNLSGQSEAQMLQLREDFAQRQLEYLKELESLKASNATLAQAAYSAAAALQKPPVVPVAPVAPVPENPAPDLKNSQTGSIVQE